MKKLNLMIVVLLISVIQSAFGQGTLRGKVTDEKGNPLPLANVILLNGTTKIGGATASDDGAYVIRPISPGKYDLVATYVGYKKYSVNSISIGNGFTVLNIQMTSDSINSIVWERQIIESPRTSTSTKSKKNCC